MKTTAITPRTKAPKAQPRLATRLNVEFVQVTDTALPVNGRAEFINRLKAGSSGRTKLKIALLESSNAQASAAGTYRALMRELSGRGHHVVLIKAGYQDSANGDGAGDHAHGRMAGYESIAELKSQYAEEVRNADAVVIGSDLAEETALFEWVFQRAGGALAFHDLNTPATLARLNSGDRASADLLRKFDLYLPQTGGSDLNRLEKSFGATMIRPFYAAVDTSVYYPDVSRQHGDLGYAGNYAEELQPGLDELMLEAARNWEQGSFVVAGSGYPRGLRWPKNVRRRPQLLPAQKRSFYCSQKFALSLSNEAMIEGGYAPAPALLEAAACGTPVISENWDGIESFFKPQEEILVSHSSEETLYYLLETTEAERALLSKKARARVLTSHTIKHRAAELETHICDVLRPTAVSRTPAA